MRINYDTEFLENGRTIELISIALVADDGREYYAVNANMPMVEIALHDWLMANVVPSLPLQNKIFGLDNPWGLDLGSPLVKPHRVIAEEVSEFIRRIPDPELWAWYGAYDHVVLSQLWGRMIDHPPWVPMWTNDLKQEWARLGRPKMPEQAEGEHNALQDARHNKRMGDFLITLEQAGVTTLSPDARYRLGASLLNRAGFYDPGTEMDS